MRMLLIHADKFDYEVKAKAIPEPEEPKNLKASVENALVAFCTIEKNDEVNPELIAFKGVSILLYNIKTILNTLFFLSIF